jgi:hypothetical protein
MEEFRQVDRVTLVLRQCSYAGRRRAWASAESGNKKLSSRKPPVRARLPSELDEFDSQIARESRCP